MAHVLVAQFDEGLTRFFLTVAEFEGHTVTVAADCWDLLMTMRATLHLMVVIYSDILLLHGPFSEDDETEEEYRAQERLWQMCERYIDDLRQHRFIETTISCGPIPEQTQHLHEQLGIIRLHMPFTVDEFFDRFDEAARHLKPAV